MAKRHARAKPVRAVEKADVAVTEAAADWKDSPAIRVTGAVADLADQPPMLAMTAGATLVGIAIGDRRLAEAGARMLASVVLAIGIKSVVKRAVDRTRPHLLVEHGHYRIGRGTKSEGRINSFPSGHTADAVAAGRALSRIYPGAAPAAAGIALGVAAIQIPRCRHFVSDVSAGALVGWLAETVVDRLLGTAAVEHIFAPVVPPDGRAEARPAQLQILPT